MSQLTFPRTASRAAQLTAASQKTTHDPFDVIDWELPIDDSAYHLPPEMLSLFGTVTWDVMSLADRIRYSRHEAAALFSAGIWFENALMQIVLRHLTTISITDSMHRYLLIEVADECRHSAMFGEYIRRAGTPTYAPDMPVIVADSAEVRTLSYVLILAIEELLDYANRAAVRDDRVHATSRAIARLHVAEEARHVSFAKSYLTEVWPTLDATEQAVVRETAPLLVAEISALSLNREVFEHLGIADGDAIARANPHHRANVIAGLSKLTDFLGDLGAIDSPATWAELGLISRG